MSHVKDFLRIAAFSILVLLPASAYPVLVTQNYALVVTIADPYNPLNVAVGDEINGFFTYDNKLIPKIGSYKIGQNWEGTENPLSVDEFQNWAPSFHLDNGFWPGPVFPYPPANGHPYIEFINGEIVGIQLWDHWDMYSLESVKIDGFHFNAWGHIMLDWDQEWFVDGRLRLYEVPETNSMYLLLSAFIALFCYGILCPFGKRA
jgi:hypothetical protein